MLSGHTSSSHLKSRSLEPATNWFQVSSREIQAAKRLANDDELWASCSGILTRLIHSHVNTSPKLYHKLAAYLPQLRHTYDDAPDETTWKFKFSIDWPLRYLMEFLQTHQNTYSYLWHINVKCVSLVNELKCITQSLFKVSLSKCHSTYESHKCFFYVIFCIYFDFCMIISIVTFSNLATTTSANAL